MIRTHWQPSYSPPGFVRQPEVVPCIKGPNGYTRDLVLAYLEANGITEKRELMKRLGMGNSKLRHALERNRGLVAHEQSISNGARLCKYWALSNPPRIDQRCVTYQAYEFVKKHPWSHASDIPDEIAPEPRKKHMRVLTLEASGELTSRVKNGRKQYKVAV